MIMPSPVDLQGWKQKLTTHLRTLQDESLEIILKAIISEMERRGIVKQPPGRVN